MNRNLCSILVTMLLLAVAGCTSAPEIPLEQRCETPADCVPAQCCHATSLVNTNYAPNCADILCSASCEPGTLDCGQGAIDCVEGQCSIAYT